MKLYLIYFRINEMALRAPLIFNFNIVVVKTNGDFYQLKRITMNYASISFQFSVFRGNICTTTGANNCFILDINNVNSPITQKNNNKLNCKVQTMRQKLKIFRRINFGLVCKHN